MKRTLVFLGVVVLVGAIVLGITNEDPVDLGGHQDVESRHEEFGFSAPTQEVLDNCLSSEFNRTRLSDAVALMDADIASMKSERNREKLLAMRESFLMSIAVKLYSEYKVWLNGTDLASTHLWHSKLSSFLTVYPGQVKLLESRRQCSELLWIAGSLDGQSEALNDRNRLLSLKFNSASLKAFQEKIKLMCRLYPKKKGLFDFKDKTALLFNDFEAFDKKWELVHPWYERDGGKHPSEFRRKKSMRLEERNIRKYAWYSSWWLEKFGEIDLTNPY